MEPVDIPVAACDDSSLGCSCGDCPGASICADISPPPPPPSEGCFVKIADYQVTPSAKTVILPCKKRQFHLLD